MGTYSSSQPASKSETESTQEEVENIQPSYLRSIDPALFTQQASNIETSQLPTTPEEALANISTFFDLSTSIPSHSRVFQSFLERYVAYMEAGCLSWKLIGYLYEQLIFSKGGDIPPLTLKDICKPRYFQPNVNLSSKEIEQPKEIRIHVFTTSDSGQVHLNEISSMVIEPSISNCDLDDFELSVVPFLEHLLTNCLENLNTFKLSGFSMTGWLWNCLSRLNLDWVHFTPRYAGGNFTFPYDPPKPKKLHMNLLESFNLFSFPRPPSLVEELSLHIFNPQNGEWPICMDHCRNLKKM